MRSDARRIPALLRRGGRSPAVGGVAPTPQIDVVALISNANYWTTTAATRPALSTMSTIAVVLRKISAGNMVREYRIERFTSATRGFRFLPCHDGVAARTTATMVSSTPANVSEQNTFSPPQNQFQVMVLVRGTTTLGIYRNGTLMSTAAAITGYSAPTTEAFELVGTGLTDELEIASISISDTTALSAGQVTAYQSTVTALGSRVIPGATHHWEATGASGATWTDSIAGVALTRVGSPVVRTILNPVFT